ncbi:MAG TPA: lysoplasmalogenase [Jatrophihabitans sp.]|nr:lysoplasmalogenase [Jatrophihabitans sp.]
MTVTLLLVAAVVAVLDWAAVSYRLFRIEYLLKPATLALLVAAAASADIGVAKPWLVAGLAFGLAGDIALMLSRDGRTDPPFIAGLSAFLLGHIGYVVGFLTIGIRVVDLLAGALIAGGIASIALPSVLRGAVRRAGRPFAGVVAAYAAVLAWMAVTAVGTGIAVTAVGGVLFMLSDTLIARARFVARMRHNDLLVIVSYHLAQFLIVLGLIRSF